MSETANSHPDETAPNRPAGVTRRNLLTGAVGAAGLAAGALLGRQLAGAGGGPTIVAPAPAAPAPSPSPSPIVVDDPTKILAPQAGAIGGRSPFVHSERIRSGYVLWSPIQDFHGTITPSDLHYVVARGGVPTIDPARYELLIHGLVEQPLVFTLDDLMRFPSVTRTLFLECGGNTGAAGPDVKPETTAQMVAGLTSTSEWTGVPVATLLREVGVKPEAAWALAEGSDAGALSRSVPLEKLLTDGLIAYAQNGEALRPEQGYPARLLLPGWVGNINVKWLRRLKLGDQPFMTRYETAQYTVPLENGQAWWWAFVLEAKSIITRPSGGQTLPKPGFLEVSGIAWSGNGRITRVEVSTDQGRTWADAALQEPVLPQSHTRFRFPWEWSGQATVLQSRATDETGYVQPTRAAIEATRGRRYGGYFNNGIIGWQIAPNGQVTYDQAT